MPLDELKKSIDAGAKGEAESIKNAATAEVKKILDDASETAKGIAKSYESETAGEIVKMRQEMSAEIERAVQVVMLEATDELIKRESRSIRSELENRLKRSAHYGVLFKKALARAQEFAPLKDLIVQVSKNDEHFVKGSGVQIEHADINGLTLRSRDGSMRVDATLDKLIDSYTEDVTKSVMAEIRRGRQPRSESAAGKPHTRAKAAVKRAAVAKKKAMKAPAKAKKKKAR
jgi:vacuolar-type H+-ATPase subunit E/Vma4